MDSIEDRGANVHDIDAALRAAGHLKPKSKVVSVTPAGVDGFGMVGDVRRLRLGYAGSTGPATVVLKRAAAPSTGGEFAEIEARWYSERMPERSGVGAPQLLASSVGGETWFLLEDLGDGGFIRQIAGCTATQAGAALDEIAALHAHWWQPGPNTPPSWLKGVADSASTHFCRTWLCGYRGGWPTEVEEIARLLVERMDDIITLVGRGPVTIVHGDFHSQNVSFGGDGAARLVDFQFVQLGAAITDVARFLATSLTTQTRRAAQHTLLRRYRTRLAESCVPEPDPGIELAALRAGFLWNLAMPLSLHVMRIMTQGASWPSSLPMISRCLEAVRDWDAETVLR